MGGDRGGEWDGGQYQARFDELEATGSQVHGEADFVSRLVGEGAAVLDAGCGTGRVALELARRGFAVTGVDLDHSMIETARLRAPRLELLEANLADLDLGRSFDVVVMAGNVLLFTEPGSQGPVVAGCARHLAPGGALVAGFSLDRGYGTRDYDLHCESAGLELAERWATWDREPFVSGGDYAVSVHRPAPMSAHG